VASSLLSLTIKTIKFASSFFKPMTYGFGYPKMGQLSKKPQISRRKGQASVTRCTVCPLSKVYEGPTLMKTGGPDWKVTTHVWAIWLYFQSHNAIMPMTI